MAYRMAQSKRMMNTVHVVCKWVSVCVFVCIYLWIMIFVDTIIEFMLRSFHWCDRMYIINCSFCSFIVFKQCVYFLFSYFVVWLLKNIVILSNFYLLLDFSLHWSSLCWASTVYGYHNIYIKLHSQNDKPPFTRILYVLFAHHHN